MVDTAKGRENFLDNASAGDVSDEALEDITDKDLRHAEIAVIHNLEYELAKATKAHNDRISLY